MESKILIHCGCGTDLSLIIVTSNSKSIECHYCGDLFNVSISNPNRDKKEMYG